MNLLGGLVESCVKTGRMAAAIAATYGEKRKKEE